MKRLAIETAFETCSVALDIDGEVRARSRTEPRAHGRLLLPFVDELLAEAGIVLGELDALVVDRGPGSFTSLRIGLGVAQGLAMAHDLPVHPVSSLAMIAAAGRDPDGPGPVLAAMDARMGEVYAAIYRFDDGRAELQGREVLCAPGDLPDPGGPARGAGSAFEVHGDRLPASIVGELASIRADVRPDAGVLLQLGAHVEPVAAHELVPVYLRDRVTH
ncbi:tRNA (adenosine(37)-N6)-threonylcarbamoyltransferase complex dimerization subunit type 1 TsaB [Halomonas denitrificans]|nr:tRNA (adenosine(37)-N6)-threonylcarbamoyltransferase complex dimerization subunit type 1 TsaB [Halomonas denitrificans]